MAAVEAPAEVALVVREAVLEGRPAALVAVLEAPVEVAHQEVRGLGAHRVGPLAQAREVPRAEALRAEQIVGVVGVLVVPR